MLVVSPLSLVVSAAMTAIVAIPVTIFVPYAVAWHVVTVIAVRHVSTGHVIPMTGVVPTIARAIGVAIPTRVGILSAVGRVVRTCRRRYNGRTDANVQVAGADG